MIHRRIERSATLPSKVFRNFDHRRRGAAVVAMVVTMLLLSLLVVGMVMGGARDQDLNRQRINTVRAFYAAESGINMAVREAITGKDEDGDGASGTVSNDGNAGNDPTLNGAQFSVSRVDVSDVATLTSTGRSGEAKRRADSTIIGKIGSSQTTMIAWGRSGSTSPRYSAWDGTTWTASTAMPSVGGNIKWVRMKICPTRNETAFVSEDEGDDVNLEFYTAGAWSNAYEVSTDTGGTNDRPEDVAYEQVSNDALSVYWKGTLSKFGFQVWNGTSFSSSGTINSPFSTECDYLTLAPRPLTDQIMLLAVDGNSGGPLTSSYWNGSTFGSWVQVCSGLESNNNECYAMAYETISGKGVCVYSQSGQSTPRYRTLTGSTWSSQSSLPSVGGVAQWIRLAADRSSDTILFASLDSSNDLNVNVWNGSSWGTNAELETSMVASDRRCFDVIYERGTSKGLIVYGESGSNSPRYRTWNGSSWSAEMSGPSIGSTTQIVHMARGFEEGEIFVAISDNARKLHVLRWKNSTLSGDVVVETNLGGTTAQQSFSLPEPTLSPQPKVSGWGETAP